MDANPNPNDYLNRSCNPSPSPQPCSLSYYSDPNPTKLNNILLTSILPLPRQVTLAVMKTHPDNAAVLEEAFGVLANLALIADNKVTIAAAGGIAVRSAALGHHLSDPLPKHTPHITQYPAPTITR
jgi:hypothetical protein